MDIIRTVVLYRCWEGAFKIIGVSIATSLLGIPLFSEVTEKFVHNFWLATYYIFVTSIQYGLLCNDDWNSYEFLTDFSNKPKFNFIYCYLTYYYLQDLYTTIVNKNTKDRNIYLVHHIATLVLLSCSYLYNYHNVGMVISFIHNLSDIFLPIGKCLNYAGSYVKNRNFIIRSAIDISGIVVYIVFAIVFIYSRLILLNTTINAVPWDERFYHLIVCLRILYCMHIGWTIQILTAFKKIVSGTYKLEEQTKMS
jgi:hypothetical protein